MNFKNYFINMNGAPPPAPTPHEEIRAAPILPANFFEK